MMVMMVMRCMFGMMGMLVMMGRWYAGCDCVWLCCL